LAEQRVYQYIIVIRNQHSRFINSIGFLLSFISLVFFFIEQLKPSRIILPYTIGIAFIAILLLQNAFQYRKKDRQIYFSKALLVAGLVWTKMPFLQWLVFIFAGLALLEYQAKHALEIGFSSTEIIFNSLIKKKWNWSDIDNVILKDGLLTVDFKNNRIFQKEIDSDIQEADDEEFNTWCRKQLNK